LNRIEALDFHIIVNGITINPLFLVVFGFAIGMLSGTFGVGGGFLVTPMLNILFGIPYELAIGASFSQMVGTSISASLRHRKLGNIDMRLALVIIIASALGVKVGGVLIGYLAAIGSLHIAGRAFDAVDFSVSIVYIVFLSLLGVTIFLETWGARKAEEDVAVVRAQCFRRLHDLGLRPLISLPASGVASISLPMMLAIGFLAGIVIGFLGVGGSFFIVPIYIYLFCIPTVRAIGTGIFQIIFISIVGTIVYALMGNVILSLVICILVGSTIGAQLGAHISSIIKQKNLRHYFSYVIMAAGLLVAGKLLFFPPEPSEQLIRQRSLSYAALCVAIPAAFGLAVGFLVPYLTKLFSRRDVEEKDQP
jgi:uncharacterized membrane protein YfcA